MLKEIPFGSITPAQLTPFAVPPGPPPITEDNLSLVTMSSIMAQQTLLLEEGRLPLETGLPLKVTARENVLLEKMAKELPNVSSSVDPAFRQAMQVIDAAREQDQKSWLRQLPEISDARVGRIVDIYLQLYDVEGIEQAGSLEDLLYLRPGLTPAQGYEKARIISLEGAVLFKLSQKGLALAKDEKLTPLAALNLSWWLHQPSPSSLADLSAAIYRPENKAIRMQAVILFNHSHYGHRSGDIAGLSPESLANIGINPLDEPEQPVIRAARALRVIHEGMHAPPAILHSSAAYLANGFAPKNAQGRYLKNQSPELTKMVLIGCGQIGFDAGSQQDFTQFLSLQHAVGSLAFSLKTTLKLHYQLQGKPLDKLDGMDTEQLYSLLLEEEQQLQQTGAVGYSPTLIFLSHFSQSNGTEALTVEQMALAFNRIAEPIDVQNLPLAVQSTFHRLKQLADNITDGIAIDLEQERFVSDLKAVAQRLEHTQPALHSLAQHKIYTTAQEKIAGQLDYLDMRLAYRHPPAVFNEEEAITAILQEKGVRDIRFARQYTYRQDPQFGFSQKEFDSPMNEFKRRRDASSHFVANMSMLGNNGRPIHVFDTLEAKKTAYYAQIKSHPALRASAIEVLIDEGQQPQGTVLQDKIKALAEDYQPESENARFWGNAWTKLENHWVCKLPVPNPMCSIARVEGPRYRNEKENMAAGMTAMVMEVSLLRGMEKGVTTAENPPQGVEPSQHPSLLADAAHIITNENSGIVETKTGANLSEEVIEPDSQKIQNPHGALIEVQRIALKDRAILSSTRPAWVRQGGGGAYWEVDLATGQDLGVVLKQGPQFIKPDRLLGGGPNRFSETHLLTNADFDWLEERALKQASTGISPCALVSSGVFTYLNTGEMSLAETFFEPLRNNIATSKSSGRFLHQLLEQFQREGIETETSIFEDNPNNFPNAFAQAIQLFPDRINIYPYDINAIKMEISQLQPGESIIFFPERSHLITIVQTANKEGLYVFDTNLINAEKLESIRSIPREIYERLLPELITQGDKKYLSGPGAADLLEMYFRPSSLRDSTAAAIIHYKGRVSPD